MLRHAVRLNSLTELALTKLDVLDGFETIRVCTGYLIDGVARTTYPDRSEVLARVDPVYVDLPGWTTDSSAARRAEELPAEAQSLLRLVEEEVGVPVRLVGVGAERDDYVVWGDGR
jgi:adenylosuccinate synthase